MKKSRWRSERLSAGFSTICGCVLNEISDVLRERSQKQRGLYTGYRKSPRKTALEEAAATAENIRRDKREYNASRPDIVDKVREAGKGGKVCAVCGGAVPAGTASVTCSSTCAAEHLRRRRARADAKRSRQKQTKTPGGEG